MNHEGSCNCRQCQYLKHISQDLRDIARDFKELVTLFTKHFTKYPVKGIISQGASMLTGTILGLAPGASDTFFCTPVDVNGNPDALPAGSPPAVFTASDPTVTIVPVATDPTGNSATVTAATGATPGGNFTLTWTATFTAAGASSPTTITSAATVPYLTPPSLNPVGGVISQGAPAQQSALAKKAAA
jgi:hypothetical protein